MAKRIGYMVEVDAQILREYPELAAKILVVEEGKVLILPGKLRLIDLDTGELIEPAD